MQKIYGIIAEFNPFHNGHEILCKRAREHGAQYIVAVMSGNFVQRGSAAITDKRIRAKAALACGVDLVIELPTPWAMSAAQVFARGAVSILQNLGCVDTLFFGSECGDIPLLEKTADAAQSGIVSEKTRAYMKDGAAYASARQKAVEECYGESVSNCLRSPNNILAVEYISAMRTLGWGAETATVLREGAGHDSGTPAGKAASGSYLRSNLEGWGEYVPAPAYEIYKEARKRGQLPASADRLEAAILSYLRRLPRERLARLPDISEGLEDRLYKGIRAAVSLDGLYEIIKTKRYTMARIRRLVLAAFLGLEREDSAGNPPYLRIIGMNEKGAAILKKAQPVLPLHTSLAKLENNSAVCARAAFLEAGAGDQYSLMMKSPYQCGFEYTASAVIIK